MCCILGKASSTSEWLNGNIIDNCLDVIHVTIKPFLVRVEHFFIFTVKGLKYGFHRGWKDIWRVVWDYVNLRLNLFRASWYSCWGLSMTSRDLYYSSWTYDQHWPVMNESRFVHDIPLPEIPAIKKDPASNLAWYEARINLLFMVVFFFSVVLVFFGGGLFLTTWPFWGSRGMKTERV